MANLIVSDVPSGITCAQIRRGAILRVPAAGIFDSTWSKVRVAVYYKYLNETTVAMGGTPKFAVGICSGSGPVPGEVGTVAHALCSETVAATWTTTANGYSISANSLQAARYAGGVRVGFATTFSYTHIQRFVEYRMFFVDITRPASPPGNWSISLFEHNPSASGTAPSNTLTDFNNLSLVQAPAFSNYVYPGNAAVTGLDEAVYGYMDRVFVSWDQYVNPPHIQALRVVRLA